MAELTKEMLNKEFLWELGLRKKDLKKRCLGQAMVKLAVWKQKNGYHRELSDTDKHDLYDVTFPFTAQNERVMNYVQDFWRRGEDLQEQIWEKAKTLVPKMEERGWTMSLTRDDIYVEISVDGCQPLKETLKLNLESIAEVLWSLTASKDCLQERLDLPFDSLMGKPEDFSELTELIEMRERLSTERMMILQNMLSLGEEFGYEFALNATGCSYRVGKSEANWHSVRLDCNAFITVTELLAHLQREREYAIASAEACLAWGKMLKLVPLLSKHADCYWWSNNWGRSEGRQPDMVLEYGRSMIVKWKDDERQQYNFCEEDYRRLLDDLSERVY